MSQIRQLFDPTRALNRPIEKVITYQNRADAQLQTEVSEYVVTERIEKCFSDLLLCMQEAHNGGAGHEIGVWVSGFYGSGKSSFTKYLGFALNRRMKVGDRTFLQLLQNQLAGNQVRALLNQVAATYDAEVIFLDLASEMLAGASMEDVSTVLYLKVLQWAGYSEELKVAELERMLEKDGKLEKFCERAKQDLDGVDWSEAHNQFLVAVPLAARLACEFYPQLFKTAEEFQNLTLHVSKSEFKRAEEMVELVRRKSGRKNILFIIDEVGQYVSAKPSLILNLDGLAKNLKQIGGGSVWLFATAQQTLTEDNASAMHNAPGLYKLKDRFPIQIHLEASDIREICHKRLLTKSANGERELGALFESSGASLRTATALSDGGIYETELSRKLFVDLYPFLPAHFDILLQLLGRLARKTGGLGLRSAIKVVQDVLIERGGRDRTRGALAESPVGTLANTVTFYDSLRRDIQGSFGHVVEGVERVVERYPKDPFHQEVAKSIAVLQILGNLPVTPHNVAALLQPDVASPSLRDRVEAATTVLTNDSMVPLAMEKGGLRFLTQAAVTLQRQFDQIEFRQVELRQEVNNTLRALFKPLPSARLFSARQVIAGLKVTLGGGQSVSLEGDREPIQFQLELVSAGRYEEVRKERTDESRSKRERCTLFLLGRADPETDQLATTSVRCRAFLNIHRTAQDPDTKEFVRLTEERLTRVSSDLERRLSASLFSGSFIAHGANKAVSECGTTLADAARAFLATAAAQVFDRYAEAPVQAETDLAEKFLKTPLDKITSSVDPLGLVVRPNGRAQIKTDHKAIVSIKDFLSQGGASEGRRLLDSFFEPPFGWSKDTVRYLLAAAFIGCEIKLRISGKDHLVKSDEALKAFETNRSIGTVGISLRDERPDPEALVRAAERMQKLTGENVLPLEDEIAKAAKQVFATLQSQYSPLAVELRSLGLGGASQAERAGNLGEDLKEIVSGDGSDAISRLGGVESPLFESLVWAQKLRRALDQGLRGRLGHLQKLQSELGSLPDTGIPRRLKTSASEILDGVADILARDSFFDESATLAKSADELDILVASATKDLAVQQTEVAESALDQWMASDDWRDLSDDDRSSIHAEVRKLSISAEGGLASLRRLLGHEYSLSLGLREIAADLKHRAASNRKSRENKSPATPSTSAEVTQTEVLVPAVFKSANDIDLLIEELRKLRGRIGDAKHLKITWKQLP
jgi:uncharacterized membrane protein